MFEKGMGFGKIYAWEDKFDHLGALDAGKDEGILSWG